MRMDGRIDMTRLKVALRSVAKAFKNTLQRAYVFVVIYSYIYNNEPYTLLTRKECIMTLQQTLNSENDNELRV